jgi:hypothetical protein
VPGDLYVNVGFRSAESITPSSWKSHAHEVGEPEDESVNATARGAAPSDGDAVKPAVGAGPG